MAVRLSEVAGMMRALWPAAGDYDFGDELVFVWEREGGGLGRAAVERWCVERGHQELGSDADLANEGSLGAHAALGFEPTLRLQFFRKRLPGSPPPAV